MATPSGSVESAVMPTTVPLAAFSSRLLAAALLSVLSPCVLPVVPPYLAYMGGISMGEMTSPGAARRRVLLPALFFVLGLSTIFLLLGFAASAAGRFFLTNQEIFNRIAGAVVFICQIT